MGADTQEDWGAWFSRSATVHRVSDEAESRAESSAEDSQSMLIRAGFIRQVCQHGFKKAEQTLIYKQTHSGLFQFLPLGLRVQEKVAALLDKHMKQLGQLRLRRGTMRESHLVFSRSLENISLNILLARSVEEVRSMAGG